MHKGQYIMRWKFTRLPECNRKYDGCWTTDETAEWFSRNAFVRRAIERDCRSRYYRSIVILVRSLWATGIVCTACEFPAPVVTLVNFVSASAFRRNAALWLMGGIWVAFGKAFVVWKWTKSKGKHMEKLKTTSSNSYTKWTP